MFTVFTLNQSQKNEISALINPPPPATPDYPEGYRKLAAMIEGQFGGNTAEKEKVVNWLEKAAKINAGDGSPISNFVRNYTKAGAVHSDIPIDIDISNAPNGDFQKASDKLANDILNKAISEGVPDAGTIVNDDVQNIVDELGIDEEAFAGAFGGSTPIWMGGLDVDWDDSVFVKLIEDLANIESFQDFQGDLENFVNLIDNHIAGGLGIAEGALAEAWEKLKKIPGDFGDAIGESYDNFVEPFTDVPQIIRDTFQDAFDFFGNAFNAPAPHQDPLVLDLDGDGLELSALAGSNTFFDLDNNDFAERTAWVSADDAFLALDRDSNGTIDNGSELFGDATPINGGTEIAADGFSALSDLDSNADGVIDANDAQFADLRVWQDLNQNGFSDAGEFRGQILL